MNKLKELRKELGISQTELAEKLNLTQRNISYWEKGTDINAYAAISLSNFFGVSIEYLLGLEDDMGERINISRTPPPNELYSEDELQLVSDYRRLSPGLKDMIKRTMDVYLKRETSAYKITTGD